MFLEILYIGTKKSNEQELVERELKRIFKSLKNASWHYKAISAGKLRRYWSLKNITDVVSIILGFFQSFNLLKNFRPDLIFCKGGYVTVPVAFAAALLRKKIWIHESDVTPGLATRINARFAEKIFVSFEESVKSFKKMFHKKIEVVGNPLRAGITQGTAERARSFTGLREKVPTILVMGGSLGSQCINDILQDVLSVLLKEYAIIHVTGQNTSSLLQHPRYRAYSFLGDELSDCYALADVIITRAGAGSVFESAAVNKPTIFIPLSHASSRGDQIDNARAAEKHSNAIVLEQELLEKNPFQLLFCLKELLNADSRKKRSSLLLNGAHHIATHFLTYYK